MAVDPLGELSGLISQYAAEDFVAQRKRLREARMRWIEENECPKAYVVKATDQQGREVSFNTPFQVGQIKYPDEYNPDWKEKPQVHADPEMEKQLLEGLDAVISQSSTEKRLTVLVAGDGEQHAFFTGGDDPESPHPAIKEGEDYDHYYARVAGQYEREAAKFGRDTRGSIACDDALRQSTPTDSPGDGRAASAGECPGSSPGAMLDRDTDAVCPGDTRPDDAAPAAAGPDAPAGADSSPATREGSVSSSADR